MCCPKGNSFINCSFFRDFDYNGHRITYQSEKRRRKSPAGFEAMTLWLMWYVLFTTFTTTELLWDFEINRYEGHKTKTWLWRHQKSEWSSKIEVISLALGWIWTGVLFIHIPMLCHLSNHHCKLFESHKWTFLPYTLMGRHFTYKHFRN